MPKRSMPKPEERQPKEGWGEERGGKGKGGGGGCLDGGGGEGRQSGALVSQQQGGDAQVSRLDVVKLQDRHLKSLVHGAVVAVDHPVLAECSRRRPPGSLRLQPKSVESRMTRTSRTVAHWVKGLICSALVDAT